MQTRMNISKIDPAAYTAMKGLENYSSSTPLNIHWKHLMKIRASQINGCAYCIEMHSGEARHAGETESRIYALSAWRESPLFSDEERALLAFTEEVTLLPQAGLTDATYDLMKTHFDEETIVHALMLVVAINGWNRIAVSTRSIHPNNLHRQTVSQN